MGPSENYIIVQYEVVSKTNLYEAAWNIAVGQSVGNPNVRSSYETPELFETHGCQVMGNHEQLRKFKNGIVEIAFPVENIGQIDGVGHLLNILMGGLVDIDIIEKCVLLAVSFP